jgi:hypothetical protein
MKLHSHDSGETGVQAGEQDSCNCSRLNTFDFSELNQQQNGAESAIYSSFRMSGFHGAIHFPAFA